uniref:Uncharacterized protein n=1 Tax=Caenorhabditis japonica TaxID=281687 RepID=A0A8R1DQ18_CAEJA
MAHQESRFSRLAHCFSFSHVSQIVRTSASEWFLFLHRTGTIRALRPIEPPFRHSSSMPVYLWYPFLVPAMGVYMIGAKEGGMQVRSTRRVFGGVKFRHCLPLLGYL